MTNIQITNADPTAIEADLLVAHLSKDGVNIDIEGVSDAVAAVDAKAKFGSKTLLPGTGTKARTIALIGTEGDELLARRAVSLSNGIEMEGTGRDRHLAAIATRGSKAKSIVLAGTFETFEQVVQSGVGAILGSYKFTKYGHEDEAGLDELVICVPETLSADGAAERISVLADSMITIMNLVNRAPNDLYPESFTNFTREVVADLPIDMDVWDEAKLEAENCGGILNVGRGSKRGPRLVKLSYAPEGASTTISLIGKGITFDSGGLSLKPPKSMETMKSDMTGAATVLATTLALAKLGVKVRVDAYMALAENMPGGGAQRPSDVIMMRGGKSVEVLNTDAEGRLVMADALALAAETDTDAIVDIATLTGAQMVGLGARTAGVMGTADVRDAIVESADRSGEAMWAAPLPSYLLESIESDVADLANSGTRWGGMLVAGVFLQEFVGDKAWAHIDIAGPSFNDGKPWGANNKGATGMSLLTLVNWAESLA
ncbi:MAG: leucyl aminopeptidase [Actinomycetaceae bacterium]|nr:leucyl aminopeptidase [Actinomycetaceae bacterium]